MKVERGSRFFIASEVEAEACGEGISRKIIGSNDDLTHLLIWWKKGAVGPAHKHDVHTQGTMIGAGKFEVELGDKKQILTAGDVFFVDINTNHGLVCLEDGFIIDNFNPIRPDFLQ